MAAKINVKDYPNVDMRHFTDMKETFGPFPDEKAKDLFKVYDHALKLSAKAAQAAVLRQEKRSEALYYAGVVTGIEAALHLFQYDDGDVTNLDSGDLIEIISEQSPDY